MTYYDISPKNHPEEYGSYTAEYDTIKLWLGGKRTPEQCKRLATHETFHMVLQSITDETTEEHDHFIIDLLECERYL